MRKPHAQNAGYVCELRCRLGGHIVIYDRDAAGVGIEADHRWIVMHEPSSNHVAIRSQAQAREVMKGLARASSIDEAREFADVLPRPGSNACEADDDGAELTLQLQAQIRRRALERRGEASSSRPRPPAAVQLDGRDVVFERFRAQSRMREDLVHLQPELEQPADAFCGADLRRDSWQRYPDLHPDRSFRVCARCFELAAARGAELLANREKNQC